jgi:hypothetical protein
MSIKIDESILSEATVGSAGLFVFGLITIPLAGLVNGVIISFVQGFGMGSFFFCTRIVWLYLVRYCFKRWGKI